MRWPWQTWRVGAGAPKRQAPLFRAELLHKLDRLQFIVPRPTTLREGTRRARSATAPHGFEVHGFRPYVWGDDLRYLDWNAYARTDELLLRVFRAERESAVYLLVDTSASMAVPLGRESVLVFAQQLALALAYVCLRRHEPTMVALLEGETAHCRRSPVWRHRGQSIEVARFLETARPSGRLDFTQAVESFLARPLLPGVSIVLSDFYAPPEEILRALASLGARRLAVVAVHLLPRSHFELNWPGGVWTVRDAETNEERTLAWDHAARTAYRAAIERHQATLRQGCQKRGFYYVHVDPEEGLEAGVFGPLIRAGILG